MYQELSAKESPPFKLHPACVQGLERESPASGDVSNGLLPLSRFSPVLLSQLLSRLSEFLLLRLLAGFFEFAISSISTFVFELARKPLAICAMLFFFAKTIAHDCMPMILSRSRSHYRADGVSNKGKPGILTANDRARFEI